MENGECGMRIRDGDSVWWMGILNGEDREIIVNVLIQKYIQKKNLSGEELKQNIKLILIKKISDKLHAMEILWGNDYFLWGKLGCNNKEWNMVCMVYCVGNFYTIQELKK